MTREPRALSGVISAPWRKINESLNEAHIFGGESPSRSANVREPRRAQDALGTSAPTATVAVFKNKFPKRDTESI